MEETDYFQKRDKYKKKKIDDEWSALKKIKTGQEKKSKPAPERQENENSGDTDEIQPD